MLETGLAREPPALYCTGLFSNVALYKPKGQHGENFLLLLVITKTSSHLTRYAVVPKVPMVAEVPTISRDPHQNRLPLPVCTCEWVFAETKTLYPDFFMQVSIFCSYIFKSRAHIYEAYQSRKSLQNFSDCSP